MVTIKVPMILSLMGGVPFGELAYLARPFKPDTWYQFVFAGILFVLLLELLIHYRHKKKRYAEVEKQIASPILYRLNGNANTGRGVRNVNIYLCEGGFAFISLDKKPYIIEELPLNDIETISVRDAVRLEIEVKNGRCYSITAADLSGLINILKKKGWIIPD